MTDDSANSADGGGAPSLLASLLDARGDGGGSGDPQRMATAGFLAGLAHGFAEGAQPSRVRVPFGAILGNAAYQANQGMDQGAADALRLQQAAARTGYLQSQTAARSAAPARQLALANLLRLQMGLPPLTPPQLGAMMGAPPSKAAQARFAAALMPNPAATPRDAAGNVVRSPYGPRVDAAPPSTSSRMTDEQLKQALGL